MAARLTPAQERAVADLRRGYVLRRPRGQRGFRLVWPDGERPAPFTTPINTRIAEKLVRDGVLAVHDQATGTRIARISLYAASVPLELRLSEAA